MNTKKEQPHDAEFYYLRGTKSAISEMSELLY
jgi:hypothetical protein